MCIPCDLKNNYGIRASFTLSTHVLEAIIKKFEQGVWFIQNDNLPVPSEKFLYLSEISYHQNFKP